ncbi:tRNA nucleotidyltransferase [Neobittarella massiliensis]|uniref:tRNA nucleotidyltransferase n=1 Tax=Neobittarella massiliensis (ex Bilen et al. 2018) TaxID=2041842 RepID=A0A8J6IMR9_9FIRM|nr:tRNA nucleotidyltransferase [Neobittarella massiliensis]
MQLQLPADIIAALRRLECAGYAAYCVGGCVRDGLLGRQTADYDIATAALPQQVKTVFAGCRTADTGIAHGTVTVLWRGRALEITTFRREATYSDGRHPDRVAFGGTIKTDLARRDFTVNAMACGADGRILDPFGGRADLAAKQLRCVGDPAVRFKEDALRILRAVRFVGVLGFAVEPVTAAAMAAQAPGLGRISAERIGAEFVRCIAGRYARQALQGYPAVFAQFMPPYGDFSCTDSHLPVRLALLFGSCRHPARAAQTLVLLRQPGALCRTVRFLVQNRSWPATADRRQLRVLTHRWGSDRLQLLCRLKVQMGSPVAARALAVAADIQAQGDCTALSQLAVSGRDLQQVGLAPGRRLGACLDWLLGEVMADRLPNRRAALLAAAQNWSAGNSGAV